MAANTSNIICTDQDFLTSALQYRQELLRIPVLHVMQVLQNMTIRTGIRYAQKQYLMDADMEFRDYNPESGKKLDVTVDPRTLYTYFGDVKRFFDPNQFYKTFLGSDIVKGEALAGVEIARKVLALVAGKLGHNLVKHIFDAKRVEGSDTSAGLYNGFDTITAAEIEKGAISAAKGNLYQFTEKLDRTNAVDGIKDFVDSADDFLLDKEKVFLYMPRNAYRDYCEDYKTTTGAIPYNREFNQVCLEGQENVIFLPMAQKRGSEFMQLTTKDNMLVGVNQMGDEEKVVVEKHDVVLLTFYASLFFGVDFERVEKEWLHVAKFYKAPATTGNDPAGGAPGNQTGEE